MFFSHPIVDMPNPNRKRNRQTKKQFRKKSHRKRARISKRRGGEPPFKPMNCSPAVKGKISNQNSCLPEDVLLKIRKEYNKDHPDKKITATNFRELWEIIRDRLHEDLKCKTEDCWLKIIDDENVRKMYDDMLFAPDKPPEWTHNPDEWLSNYDISDVLKQYESTYPDFKYFDPSPIDFDSKPTGENGRCVTDELCKFNLKDYYHDETSNKNKTKFGMVFNLDKHDEPGSHWVSLFTDLKDKQKPFIMYFDSAGDEIQPEIKELADRIIIQAKDLGIQLTSNYERFEHQRGNSECGMYCLYYIISLLTGKAGKLKNTGGNPDNSSSELINLHDYAAKVEYFKGGQRIPDQYVFKKRDEYFNNQK
jgi:hypothetical protein